jgi:hypothetical protein
MTDNVEELVKQALHNKDIGISYTSHGERGVVYKDGKHVAVPFEEVEFEEPHKRFNAKHHEVMEVIYSAVCDIVNMKRSIPLTRNELIRPAAKRGVTTNGISKKLVNDLIDFDLIQERIIKIVNIEQKPVRSQAVIYFTNKGRSYVRERIDQSYNPQ